MLLLDGTRGLEAQDLKIADHVLQEGRALIIAINKWDVAEDASSLFNGIKAALEEGLSQARGVPLLTVSGKTGKGIDQLLGAAFEVRETWSKRVSTGQLNRWFEDAVEKNPPPAPGGKRIKLRYITQVEHPAAELRPVRHAHRSAAGFLSALSDQRHPPRARLRRGAGPPAGPRLAQSVRRPRDKTLPEPVRVRYGVSTAAASTSCLRSGVRSGRPERKGNRRWTSSSTGATFSRMRTQLGASFVRILGYFREDGEKAVGRIEEAMHRQDAAGLVLPAHTLKAEARQFGAEPVAALAEEIEDAGRRAVEGGFFPDNILPQVARAAPALPAHGRRAGGGDQPAGSAPPGLRPRPVQPGIRPALSRAPFRLRSAVPRA